MNKLISALIIAIIIVIGAFGEPLIKSDFVYVNELNCNDSKISKNQKIITQLLFGDEISLKMGCNTKKQGQTSKAYDIPFICKYQKDTNNKDQRCFGLNIYSKYEEGKSIYSPVYGSGFALNHKPRSSKDIVNSKIVYSSYSFCHSIPINIEEDWFYVIQDLMTNNGWIVESENNKERSIHYSPPKKDNTISGLSLIIAKIALPSFQVSNSSTNSIINYGPEEFPEAEKNRQKLLSTTDPFLFDSINLNGPKFIRFKKEDIYAEISWFEKEYRDWMHSLYRHDTKTYTFPNAMLFIYDFKKIGRGNLIGPNCLGYAYKKNK